MPTTTGQAVARWCNDQAAKLRAFMREHGYEPERADKSSKAHFERLRSGLLRDLRSAVAIIDGLVQDRARPTYGETVACLEAVAERYREASPPADEEQGNTWQEVAERLTRLCDQGRPFTSRGKMAKQIGCSSATVQKAIQNTPSLHGWAHFQAQPGARSLDSMVTDNAKQSTELDPADEAAIREFVETADEATKGWFLGLPVGHQLEYLSDPDRFDTVLGRRP